MKKIVAILWHNSANRMRVLREEVEKIADVRIFSAGSLGDGEEDINDLYAAIDQADLLLLNETASDPIWKEINEYIKNSTLPMVYVGGEAATHVKNAQQAKWTAFANAYYTYGGVSQEDFLLNLQKPLKASTKKLLRLLFTQPTAFPALQSKLTTTSLSPQS